MLFRWEKKSGVSAVVYTLIVIALGLVVPYLMLKLGVFSAHLKNPEEKNIRLKDFPKDKDQMARKVSR